MPHTSSSTTLIDVSPDRREFLADVVTGLSASPKRLPSKYFYDERGSALFDRICELDEYYLTRTELDIMGRHAREIAEQIGPGAMLIEYGSGSSIKTRWLIEELEQPAAYVPVDISREHLQRIASELQETYPHIEVLPVCADFTEGITLPRPRRRPTHVAFYFPGSTIGNFEPWTAQMILQDMADIGGPDAGLVIGIDLQKPLASLHSAYNDSEGVTAAFNRNLLARINRELDGDFRLRNFAHRALYNDSAARMEMHLVSLLDQEVTVAGETFEFLAGESICTEYSHKYTIESFTRLAAGAGFALHHSWTDDDNLFAVLHLVVE